MGEPTVAEALAEGRDTLGRSRGTVAPREARLLLAEVLGWTETEVVARDDRPLDGESLSRYRRLVRRRAAAEPFAYLTGRREFYGRELLVDDRVLVPRPETEHAVEACLELAAGREPRILDVGTGSGAIALTLALERPGARVVGTDRSLSALAVARRNAGRLGATVDLALTDLADGVNLEACDLVVSNPPYLPLARISELPPDVKDFEPHPALFGGPEGLETVERLLEQLTGLRPGTPLVLEVGDGQADAVAALLEASGFRFSRALPDYSGTPRVVIGTRAPWTASRS